MRKVRLALFFGYSGADFNGMQHQRESHVKTIQNQLIQKFFAEGFLKTNVFNELVKNYKWSRAARTDKGVHALVNGISCIFTIKNQYWIESEEQQLTTKQGQEPYHRKIHVLNKQLLLQTFQSFFDSFSIYSIKEVEKKFDMRMSVKSRTYCYMCPLKIFHNPDKLADDQILNKINRLCQYFKGTKNFHNYSSGMKAKDPAAKRYILSMKCQRQMTDHLVEKSENKQIWVRFRIHGQSFIYHQIRKMIGMVIQVFFQNTPENFIQNTFFNNQMRILLAPPEGLYLESLMFDSYNRGMYIPEKLTFDRQLPLIQSKRIELQKIIILSESLDEKFSKFWEKLSSGEDKLEQIEVQPQLIEE